jgi:hypothetical protein
MLRCQIKRQKKTDPEEPHSIACQILPHHFSRRYKKLNLLKPLQLLYFQTEKLIKNWVGSQEDALHWM